MMMWTSTPTKSTLTEAISAKTTTTTTTTRLTISMTTKMMHRMETVNGSEMKVEIVKGIKNDIIMHMTPTNKPSRNDRIVVTLKDRVLSKY
mmetsp:Transcript_25074/g.28111  ORF Transcript_25074/g.28111 Transcript_25074/m.28111 type:complete len:91 (+) Transcript_25074:896-1168(+)